MAEEPLIVGSNDTITGKVYDNQDGVLTEVDLTGATLALKARFNGGTAVSWTATPHPDQVNHPGEYSYTLGNTDLSPGALEIQAWVTVGAAVYKSAVIDRTVNPSL